MEKRFILSRHSKKPNKENPESQKYPGLSELGVEQARKEKALELKEAVDRAPERALIFIGATSELIRTNSTARLYGEGLKDLYEGDESVVVLTEEDANKIRKGEMGKFSKSFSQGIESLAAFINGEENKDKKIVLTSPLFIKQFSMVKRWSDEYYDYLDKKYGDDEVGWMKEWFKTKGDSGIEGLKGPHPDKVAEEYLVGFERLRKFGQGYLENRPLVITSVSHAPDLDAAIVKLINGEASPEAIDLIMKEGFMETNEGAEVVMDGNKTRVNFRGKKYELESTADNS